MKIGNGIPQKALDKIFQPPSDLVIPIRTGTGGRAGFFTTKPTGQACPTESFRRGTRLGLSLSYDIIKAHGGELKVETLPVRQAGLSVERQQDIISARMTLSDWKIYQVYNNITFQIKM